MMWINDLVFGICLAMIVLAFGLVMAIDRHYSYEGMVSIRTFREVDREIRNAMERLKEVKKIDR